MADLILKNLYILLDVFLCSTAEYFTRFLQTKSKNTQRYYTTKRLIRDFLSNTPNCFADIYLRGLRDRSMRSETELAREIQLADWSTAAEQGKLIFVVSTKPSPAQFISLFTTGKIVLRLSKSHFNSKFSF